MGRYTVKPHALLAALIELEHALTLCHLASPLVVFVVGIVDVPYPSFGLVHGCHASPSLVPYEHEGRGAILPCFRLAVYLASTPLDIGARRNAVCTT